MKSLQVLFTGTSVPWSGSSRSIWLCPGPWESSTMCSGSSVSLPRAGTGRGRRRRTARGSSPASVTACLAASCSPGSSQVKKKSNVRYAVPVVISSSKSRWQWRTTLATVARLIENGKFWRTSFKIFHSRRISLRLRLMIMFREIYMSCIIWRQRFHR